MAVPLLDLAAQHALLSEALERALREVLSKQCFILGPVVERFERNVAEYLGVPHAIGVSSGTDALVLSLLAEGVGSDDEVITTPFSFFATAGAIRRVGARPIFVDIEPGSFNLDPNQVQTALSPRTRAVLPVHLFGRAADLTSLLAVCRGQNLALIEDAAQAMGTRVSDGSGWAGALGDFGCFSFFPSKNLGGAGDGGLVVCRDPERASRVRRLRVHGAREPHLHEAVGGNFRLDALQAAVLDVKLPFLEEWVAGRRRNAERYRQLFVEAGLSAPTETFPSERFPIALPEPAAGHSYNQFVVRTLRRDALAEHLKSRKIGHAVYYPRPLHLQPILREFGKGAGSLPEAERAAREVLALPVFPELSQSQAEEVVEAIRSFFTDGGSTR